MSSTVQDFIGLIVLEVCSRSQVVATLLHVARASIPDLGARCLQIHLGSIEQGQGDTPTLTYTAFDLNSFCKKFLQPTSSSIPE
jgi:hypothetical protein